MKRESEKEQVQVSLAEQKAKASGADKTIIEFKNPFEKVKFEKPSWLNIKGGKRTSSATSNSDTSQVSLEEKGQMRHLSSMFLDGSKRILPFFRAPRHRGGIC